MEQTKEIWKDIVGYEGVYQVSNKGRVRSLAKKMSCGINFRAKFIREGLILKPQVKKGGYYSVNLYSTKMETKSVHRIVALAFIENPDNKKCVNHIDFDRTNNCVENLEWVTHQENTNHSYNRITPQSIATIRKFNALRPNDKPVIQMDMEGNFIKEYPSMKVASIAMCGSATSTISNHIYYPVERKSAYKFKWAFKEQAQSV